MNAGKKTALAAFLYYFSWVGMSVLSLLSYFDIVLDRWTGFGLFTLFWAGSAVSIWLTPHKRSTRILLNVLIALTMLLQIIALIR